MYIYLTVFTVCLIIAIAISKKGNKTVIFIFGSIIIVGLLTLLAGLRASSIGTDTTSYALPLYEVASLNTTFNNFYSDSWYRIWRDSSVSDFEIGYLIVVWISNKIGSFQFQLFLTSLLTVVPFYWSFAKRKDIVSLPICMIMFMLIYFNTTLNGMRQWIALALVFLAIFGEYENEVPLRRQWKVFLILLCAISFHNSAILGFLILIIRVIANSKRAIVYYIIITTCMIISVLAVGFLRQFVTAIGFEKYLSYLGTGSIHFVVSGLLLQIPFLLFSILLYRSKKIENNIAVFYLTMMTVSVIGSQFASLGMHSSRIFLYFDIFEIPLMGILVKLMRGSNRNNSLLTSSLSSLIISIFCLAYSLCYWLYYYLLCNSGETIPYLFFWQ